VLIRESDLAAGGANAHNGPLTRIESPNRFVSHMDMKNGQSPNDFTAPPPEVADADDSETVTLGPGASKTGQDDSFTVEAAKHSHPARQFGKYELIGQLGRGGMGVVFKARQTDLDRIVALKMILSSHLASQDQVARFQAEARTAAQLRDPHIVAIHEVGEHGGQHYFAMQYIDGENLARRLRRGPMPPENAARLVMVVGRAVHSLHRQGMIHRDLKPSNILIDQAGTPFVSDFGLAKVLGAEGQMTHSGTVVGTPSYMSPEQAANRVDQIGPASDVYSLGAILFEALIGRPAYSGESPVETLVQVLEGEPPRPRRLDPKVPRALARICLNCLEKNPNDRSPTAAALAEDLHHFLRGEPIEAGRDGFWHRLRRWVRREPALASRLGTMALCGAIVQGNRYLIGDPIAPSQRSIGVVIVWALASIFFQEFLRRGRAANLVRYAWAAVDVVLFSLLVYVNQGLNTSLVAGYFVIVSASGLWFRERVVWLTTMLSVFAYALLAVNQGLTEMQESPYRNVVFASVLAASGFIVSYQVRRVRALSRYYEHRPV